MRSGRLSGLADLLRRIVTDQAGKLRTGLPVSQKTEAEGGLPAYFGMRIAQP